jgi:hypothetical protein
MLGECMVGIMVSEEQAPSDSGGLEDMDWAIMRGWRSGEKVVYK